MQVRKKQSHGEQGEIIYCLLVLCVLFHSSKFSLSKKYAHINLPILNRCVKSYSENNFQNILTGTIYTLKAYIYASLQIQVRLARVFSVSPHQTPSFIG